MTDFPARPPDFWAIARALFILLGLSFWAQLLFHTGYTAYASRPEPRALFYCALMPLLLLVLLALQNRQRQRLGLSWAELGFRRPRRSLLQLLWQLPLAYGLLLLLFHGLRLLVGAPLSPGPTPLPPWWLFAASIIFLVPLVEEIVFRGLLFCHLQPRYRRRGVLGWSSALFALIHLSEGTLLLQPYFFLMGWLLGWLRLHHRNLWAAVALHCFINAGATLIPLLT